MTETKTPESILQSAAMPQDVRAQAWDLYNSSADENELADKLKSLPIPDSAKADLWDLKHETIQSHAREINIQRQSEQAKAILLKHQQANYPSQQERQAQHPKTDWLTHPAGDPRGLGWSAFDAMSGDTLKEKIPGLQGGLGFPMEGAAPTSATGVGELLQSLKNMPALPVRIQGMLSRMLSGMIPEPAAERTLLTAGPAQLGPPASGSSVSATTVPWEQMPGNPLTQGIPKQLSAGVQESTLQATPTHYGNSVHEMPPMGGQILQPERQIAATASSPKLLAGPRVFAMPSGATEIPANDDKVQTLMNMLNKLPANVQAKLGTDQYAPFSTFNRIRNPVTAPTATEEPGDLISKLEQSLKIAKAKK